VSVLCFVFYIYLFLVSGGKWDGRMGGWWMGGWWMEDGGWTDGENDATSHLSTQDERKLN
jgi:hypothetical protein